MSEYQLNFINYFEKTQKAIIHALKDSCEIIEKCLELVPEFKSMRKVIATQLRLLLVDSNNSLVLKAFNDFKLSPLKDDYIKIHEDLYCINAKDIFNIFDTTKNDIELNKWLNQSLYYFDRDIDSLPKKLDSIFFNQILDKFKKNSDGYKFILNCFNIKEIGDSDDVARLYYCLNENINCNNRTRLLHLLNSRGYNNLTIAMLIKLVADKEGAHSDSNTPIGLLFSNIADDKITYLDIVALMVVKKIRELIEKKYTEMKA